MKKEKKKEAELIGAVYGKQVLVTPEALEDMENLGLTEKDKRKLKSKIIDALASRKGE